jgi:orotate phosphoribosyltransferase
MSVNLFDEKLAIEIAEHLVNIESIKINVEQPYTWASGWLSPIYCDNRLSLSYPEIRKLISESLVSIIKEKYADVECIAGVATAGIPQGALVAEALGVPFIYVRSKKKGHGMENLIEGVAKKGQKVVVIEDLVSTGGSSIQAAESLRHEGMEVLGMAAIFTYSFGISEDNFKAHHIDLWYLSDYPTLIESLIQKGELKKEQEATLQSWRSNPALWNQ